MAEPLTEERALTLQPGTVLHRTTKGYEWTRVVHQVNPLRDDDGNLQLGEDGKPRLDQILFVPLPDKPVPPWAYDAIGPRVLHEWIVAEPE